VSFDATKPWKRPLLPPIEASVDSNLYRITDEFELYLGSQDSAANVSSLEKSGISHVLNVATGIEYEKSANICYRTIEILDLPEEKISNSLPHCFEFILNALDNGGKVLVHCNAGVSRSPSIVIVVLMKLKNLSFEAALEIVKKAKKDVRPNEGFEKQLRDMKF